MAKSWGRAKESLKGRNLDEEFEQFLNESLSEESSGALLNKTPGKRAAKSHDTLKKSKELQGEGSDYAAKPWWASQDDDDDAQHGKVESVIKSWMKPKPREADIIEEKDPDGNDSKEGENDNVQPETTGDKLRQSNFMSSGAFTDTGGISMSKDSLEEAAVPETKKPQLSKVQEERIKKQPDHYEDDFDEENLTYSMTEPTVDTGSPDRVFSPGGGSGDMGRPLVSRQDTLADQPGMETLDEDAEKEQFFAQLEQSTESAVDYGKLNKALDLETSNDSFLRTGESNLQATGTELGDSILNESVLEAESGAVEDPKYSEDFDQTAEEPHEESPEPTASPQQETTVKENEKQVNNAPGKPSMLAKVSLMESLDSTLGTTMKHTQPRLAEQLHRDNYASSLKGQEEGINQQGTGTLGMGGTRDTAGYTTTGDMAELQQALQDAHMDTADSDKMYMGKFELPPTPTIIKGAHDDSDEEDDSESNKSMSKETQGLQPVAAKRSQGFNLQPAADVQPVVDSRAHGFDLQPAVDSRAHGFDLQPAVDSRAHGFDLQPPVDSRAHGFDIQPAAVDANISYPRKDVSGFNRNYPHESGANEKQGIALTPGKPTDFALQSPEKKTPIKPATQAQELEGFSLRPVADNEPSGFDLQPVTSTPHAHEERFGSALDSALVAAERERRLKEKIEYDRGIKEARGLDLQPVANLLNSISSELGIEDDFPPADSLKGIKSIAKARRSGQSIEDKSTSGRTKISKDRKGGSPKRSTADLSPKRASKVGKSRAKEVGVKQSKGRGTGKQSETSRFGWQQPSPSSRPSWSPTSTVKEKKKTKKSLQSTEQAPSKSQASQLAVSVESFANYLKHFVRPEQDEARAQWADMGPNQSVSPVRAEHDVDRLSREKALQGEVESWRLAWQDENKRNDKLLADISAREKEWARKEESSRLEYEKEIYDLKQEMFVLQSNAEAEKKEALIKKRSLTGPELESLSAVELERMQREVREQEELLKGYQQENERLYKDLKQQQAKGKTTEARMFSENQKLATDFANFKEKLERFEGGAGGADHVPSSGASLGAERINNLQHQLQTIRKQDNDLRKELEDVKHTNIQLQAKVTALGYENDKALERTTVALHSNTSDMKDLETHHKEQIARLERKLKWYAENQEMLDRDDQALRRKDQEIKELKEAITSLQKQAGRNANDKDNRNKERTSDARRIQDLERQVREMEEIIRRRYPNSLPALIYAAASSPGTAQPTPAAIDSPEKSKPSYLYLENQIKKLHSQLSERDEQAAKNIRVIEQKYNAMVLDYEERVKSLERDLQTLRDKYKTPSHPYTHAQALDKELDAVRSANQRKVKDLEHEIDLLKETLGRVTSSQSQHGAPSSKRKKNEGDEERLVKIEEEFKARIKDMSHDLMERDQEILELKNLCEELQEERNRLRETVVISRESIAPEEQPTKRLSNSPERLPSSETIQLRDENRQLRDKISNLSTDLEHQKIRLERALGDNDSIIRRVRENAAKDIDHCKAQHKDELIQLKASFALEQSSSKTTELKNKIASQEIVIQRLKMKLADTAISTEDLAASKVREERLQHEVKQLQDDIKRAREIMSPEMRHFESLQSKISAIEHRNAQRDMELRRAVDSTQVTASIERQELETKYKQIVRKKNEEIEHFRNELDAILEVLRELKRQGVVIPLR